MTPHYTRACPSPRYRQLLAQYRQLHEEGERRLHLPAEQTYNGASLPRHAGRIGALVERHGAKSLLDYGSGKGHQYRPMEVRLPDGRTFPSIPAFWGVTVTCYDPAYEPFQQLPAGKFDGVVCTDVLEHCPEQDLPWIVEELFGFARQFVFANVACYAAKKHLPNGENAHCTVRPREWWAELVRQIKARHPEVHCEFALDEPVTLADGQTKIGQCLITG